MTGKDIENLYEIPTLPEHGNMRKLFYYHKLLCKNLRAGCQGDKICAGSKPGNIQFINSFSRILLLYICKLILLFTCYITNQNIYIPL